MPLTFNLGQNYPNPFNPTTTIRYELAQPGKVSLTVHNLLGQKVLTVVDTYQPAGYYTVTLDGRQLSSGLYFYRIETEHFRQTRKMMILK